MNHTHYQEWLQSGITPSLITTNLISLEGMQAVEFYCSHIPTEKQYRKNDGRVRDCFLKKADHLYNGGWVTYTVHPLTGEITDWGQIKPNTPRVPLGKSKPVKYESPITSATRMMWLDVPIDVWERIATKWNCPAPSKNETHFWHWVAHTPEIPLCITEGVKKAACLLSQGYPAIAVTGVWNNNPKPWEQTLTECNPELSPYLTEKREVCIVFDEDTKLNTVTQIEKATKRLLTNLKQYPVDASVLTWDPLSGKGIDDVLYNTPSLMEQLWNERKTTSEWLLARVEKIHAECLHINERYFPDIAIPHEAQLVALKGKKGTGKTNFLARQVAPFLSEGIPVYIMTHRVQLARALGDVLGVPYRAERFQTEQGALLGFSLCVDSLTEKNIQVNDLTDSIIILDEVDQVLLHAVQAKTDIKKHRPESLSLLGTMIQGSLRTYIASADLTDLELSTLEKIADTTSFSIVNDYTPHKGHREAYFYPDRETALATTLSLLNEGKNILLMLDAQKAKSKWGSITLERLLREKAQLHDTEILRVDSQTTETTDHEAVGITQKLDTLSQYRCVITTPVFSTGISIEDTHNHFDAVVYIGSGTQTANDVCQMIERLRQPVPRHIYVPKTRRCPNTTSKEVWSHHLTTCKHHIGQLAQAGLCLDIQYSHIWLQLYAEYQEREAIKSIYYREAIYTKMKEEGYVLHMIHDSYNQAHDMKKSVTLTRDKNWEQETNNVVEAEELCSDHVEAIKKQKTRTLPQQRALKRFAIKKRYGVVTKEIVKADEQGAYQKLRLLFWLTEGRQHLLERDLAVATTYHEDNKGNFFIPDFNGALYTAKICALEALKIHTLLHPDTLFTNENLREWGEHLKSLSPHALKQVKTLLGINLLTEQDSLIQKLSKVLRRLGLTLTFAGKTGGRGQQIRNYRVTYPDYLPEVFSMWNDQQEEKSVASNCNKEQEERSLPTGHRNVEDHP